MLWTLLALVTMVALGGFIAYYGDLQGRRWGKRRVSKFGLRPKHTAILITSLTGAFIALISIVSLLIISPTVRDVVLRGESAIRENKRLNAELVEQRINADKLAQDSRNRQQIAAADLANALRDVGEKSRQKDQLTQQVMRLTTSEKNLSAESMRLQREFYRAQRDVEQRRDEIRKLEVLKRDLAQRNLTLTDRNAAAKKINEEIARQNTELVRSNAELSKISDQFKEQNARLIDGNKGLLETRDRLIATNADLQKANDVMSRTNKQLLEANRLDIAQAQEKIEQLNREFKFLSNERVNIANSYIALRRGNFSLRKGAELARRTLDAHMRPDAVGRELTELLDKAETVAMVHGAVRGENGRAVAIITKHGVTEAGNQEADADEKASLAYLIEHLSGQDTPIVVVANVVHNSVEKEQVLIELSTFKLLRLFDKNQVVASATIDARQPTERVFDSVVQFLNNNVRDAALQKGAIPKNDPETGQPRVGSFDTSYLLKLTDDIRKRGGLVQISAVASDEITSADTLDMLRLTFKLSRPPATRTAHN